MKQYAINTENSRIVYNNLGAGFQSSPWRILDENNQDDIILINNFNLKEEKDEKLRQLEINRKAYQFRDIELDGVNYVVTQTAAHNLSIAIGFMVKADLDHLNWLDSDDNAVALDKTKAESLEVAIFNQYSQAYHQEADKIKAINACTSLEELDNIDINFS